MGEMIYNTLCKYYHALEVKGYIPYSQVKKLLVLTFYKDFVYHDYYAKLSREDYLLIERALDCLYGSSCLIPYPDYLKMGKLHLGAMTELAARLRVVETEPVLKLVHDLDSVLNKDSESDILVMSEDEQ